MRHYRSYQSNGTGLGIFFLILVFLPAIGWIFGFLSWMIDNIGWILVWITIFIIISLLVNASLKDDIEEEDINE